MSHKIPGQGEHARKFAEALGIDPKKACRIELIIAPDELITVKVWQHIYDTELDELSAVLTEYELHEKDDGRT